MKNKQWRRIKDESVVLTKHMRKISARHNTCEWRITFRVIPVDALLAVVMIELEANGKFHVFRLFIYKSS